MKWRLIKLLTGLLASIIVGQIFLLNSASAQEYHPGSAVDHFCRVQTPVGYYEHMGLVDENDNWLPYNYIVQVEGDKSYIDVRFKVEVWFCKMRSNRQSAYFETYNYRAIDSVTGQNRFSSISPTSARIYPSPRGGVIKQSTMANYMVVPTHTARLDLRGLADGATRRVCLAKMQFSNYPGSYHQEGQPYCFNMTVKRLYSVSARAATNISSNQAYPGQTVTWTHTVTNNGPGKTKDTITSWEVDSDLKDNGYRSSVAAGIEPGRTIRRFNTSYKITQDDINKTICRAVAFNPIGSKNRGTGYSNQACVFVPYNYSLTPVINVSSDAIADGASLVSGINASIRNSGPTVSDKANYSVIRFVVRGDQDTNITGGDDVLVPRNPSAPGNLISDWPCEVARQIGSRTGLNIDSDNCLGGGLPSKGSGTVIGLSGLPISVPDNDVSDLNLAVGDRLCYTTIVSTYGAKIGRDRFRYAAPKCLVVAKKPKVQFWGGDVRAGKEVITSLSRRGAAYYGSWAEYALFSATTSVDATSSSGAGLSATAAGRDIAGGPISYNRITFGNTPIYGGFNASQSVIPSIFLASGTNITASNVDVNALPSGVNTRSGNLTLRASTLAPGKRIFIRATGTVTIDGNINYATGPFASLSDMPQLAIIAQNIIINPDVTELNGWLIRS